MLGEVETLAAVEKLVELGESVLALEPLLCSISRPEVEGLASNGIAVVTNWSLEERRELDESAGPVAGWRDLLRSGICWPPISMALSAPNGWLVVVDVEVKAGIVVCCCCC